MILRVTEGGISFEVRQLCAGGELFDLLLSEYEGATPLEEALRLFAQICAAVAHCHHHGAVHGQLHPENVLAATSPDGDPSKPNVELTGFVCGTASEDDAAEHTSLSSSSSSSSVNSSSPSPPSPQAPLSKASIRLRPLHDLDAPELDGCKHAMAHELMACDMWACGVLLVALITGEAPAPDAAASLDRFPADGSGHHGGHLLAHVVWIARCLLGPEPDKRPTAAALMNELERMGLAPIAAA